MKKSLQLLIFVIGVLLLTGCATVQDRIVINSEGKVLRDVQIEFDVTEENKISTALAQEEIEKRAAEEGYQLKIDDTVEGKIKYNLIKSLDSVDPNTVTIPYLNEVTGEEGTKNSQLLTITKEQGLFKSNFSANSQFEISELAMYDGVDYTLSVYLPSTKLNGQTNAIDIMTNEKNKNQQLVWKTNEAHAIDVQFDVSKLNILYIVWFAGIALLLIISGIYFILRKKEKELETTIHRRIPTRQYSQQRHSRRY